MRIQKMSHAVNMPFLKNMLKVCWFLFRELTKNYPSIISNIYALCNTEYNFRNRSKLLSVVAHVSITSPCYTSGLSEDVCTLGVSWKKE